MKKRICLVICIGLCCLLCACDPGSYSPEAESLGDIVSIELIEYTNEHQDHFISWVPDQFDQLLPFDSDNATVLETLPVEKIADFLDAFQKTEILSEYYVYNSPKDICIRLNDANGDFLIIWANYAEGSFVGYIGEYASDGTVLSFWGCFSALQYYKDLVNQFFIYQLP